MSDVNLKREAFAPLLNPSPPVGSNIPLDELPLHLKLVKGKVGHMRFQIPWKRLVWGQGDVRLQISDVDIVLAYESREETQRRMRLTKQFDGTSVDKKDHSNDVEVKPEITEEQRERKQKWLQEAERRQLQGLPIPESFESATKKKEKKDDDDDLPENQKEAKHVDSFLQQATSSIIWRFFAGLQASVRNVRIVIIQDGVEIGVITHSMDVKPGKQQAATTATESTAMDLSFHNEQNSSNSMDLSSFATPPDENFEYEGEFEDGELVEKTCEVNGFGIFVRKVPKIAAAPPHHLKFSLSVGPDDYILRPTNFSLYHNFFYPHPPDKQKKKKKIIKEEAKERRISGSDSAVSASSSKIRRGKRDHAPVPQVDTSIAPADIISSGSLGRPPQRPGKGHKRVTSEPIQAFDLGLSRPSRGISRVASLTDMKGAARKRLHSSSHGSVDGRPETNQVGALLPPMTKLMENKSGTYSLGYTNEARSVMDTSRDQATRNSKIEATVKSSQSPRLELQLMFGELKTVFSSRHYHYSLTFLSTITRMRNGRPEKRIRNFLGEETPDTIRSVTVTTPMVSKTSDDVPKIPKPSSIRKRATTESFLSTSSSSLLSPTTPTLPAPSNIPSPLAPTLVRFQSEGAPSSRKIELRLNFQPVIRTERAKVVRSWWIYAYKNALRELSERREKKEKFKRATFKFDWAKQRRRRREYVNLYLSQSGSKSSALLSVETAALLLRGRNAEEIMMTIEDELPIEQILLYRSIARALRVRGFHEMKGSILSLRKDDYSPLMTPKKKDSQSEKQKRNTFRKMNLLKHSGSDWAVDESRTFSGMKSVSSVANPLTVGSLQKRCGEARNRRVGNETTREKRSIDSTLADADTNTKEKKQSRGGFGFTSPVQPLPSKTAGIRSIGRSKGVSGGSSRIGHDSPMTVEVSRAGDMTDRSFKTAMSCAQKKKGTEKVSNQLRFSFTFKLEKLELLILKDAPLRHLPTTNLDTLNESSSVSDDGKSSRLTTSDDGDESSDGISYLTDAFSDAGDAESTIMEEVEDTPILSSTDFLTFGIPGGVIFDVCVTPLQIFLTGLSGGSKKAAFNVGRVVIRGEDNCPLIEAGSHRSRDAREIFAVPDISIEQKRRNTLRRGLTHSGNEKEAIKVSFLKMDEQERFLEIDIAKIFISAEVGAIGSVIKFARSTRVTLPRPLLAHSALDEVRDYFLHQSPPSHFVGEVATLDCAMRLHGVDVCVPAFEQVLDEQSAPHCSGNRKQIRAALSLVEYYSGSLVERISFAANENVDLFSRKSSGFATAVSTPGEETFFLEQRLELLNISEIFDKQRGMGSAHAVSESLFPLPHFVAPLIILFISDNQRVRDGVIC